MNDTAPPASELFVTQFLVVSDQDRSRDFYQSVFGAEVVRNREPGHPGAGQYAHRAQYRQRPDR